MVGLGRQIAIFGILDVLVVYLHIYYIGKYMGGLFWVIVSSRLALLVIYTSFFTLIVCAWYDMLVLLAL
ncbi:hypothetical protein F4679DRAFT_552952 [Xylaria curta]|nr:hypothetical protein F4679DRAFT_552952 [Xylaria curta]